ncbi:NAD(P)H-dependent oxidoreductase [Chitiniphilus purpureus]|uniref:NAD(P)H-dependent oxidoreductase n=1 Tax=Chitiniphilus purpureus TaxID=2981137 RepID=A0ABY6DRN4_9NEIS|nr:NAD(P)H-dependent oxidoreductase [Chitiniphilus sp. CD1]UXY15741.1 NAD(P)H-dependent oxidoreductase [Chitiniphilus sp. CD1]
MRVLVINGNPKPASLCQGLALSYALGARAAGHTLRVREVGQLDYEPDLRHGYDAPAPLEPDLLQMQHDLQWAEHLLLVAPVWWGTLPARMQGLLERVLLPGFAFRYHAGRAQPEPLLAGRSAELMITLDTPAWYYRYWQGAPVERQLRRAVLELVGIKVGRCRYLGPVRSADDARRARWLDEAKTLGATLI